MPQRNTALRLMKITKTIYNLRRGFNKVIETLKKMQTEIKMEWVNSIIQLED